MLRTLEVALQEKLQDEEFAEEYHRFETLSQIALQVITLRQERGLTQSELAKLAGTKQSSISRLENMASTPSLSFLRRVASALDSRLQVYLKDKKVDGEDESYELNSVEEINHVILLYRKKRGFTQSKLAEFIGTKQSTISRLEKTENISLSFFQRIVNVLDLQLKIYFVPSITN